MVATPGSPAPRSAPGSSGTGRLVFYLALGATLMVADHRGRYVDAAHTAAQALAGPAYALASAPSRAVSGLADAFRERRGLLQENERLRQDLLQLRATLAKSASTDEENLHLRRLLRARDRIGLETLLAHPVEVDLDPFRQRILLDRGSEQGVRVGLAVIDDRGVLGQVSRVERDRAEVVLITDASHALPVTLLRTGLRTIAFGVGDGHTLRLPYIPFSADVREGDELVTSGLGGRYPAGLPAGTVRSIKPGDAGTFAVGIAAPASDTARADLVLLLSERRLPLRYDDGTVVEWQGPPESLETPRAEPVPESSP